jgi:hypothetical protein
MSSNLLSKHELEEKIRVNAERLGQLTAPEDKRIKKRVLQTLGKLKKQLAEVTGTTTGTTTTGTATGTTTGSATGTTTGTTTGTDSSNNVVILDTKDTIHTTSTDGVSEVLDVASGAGSSAPVWNKKKAKLKLRIVNAEIAELALKKQLKMAKKRFNWLSNRGLHPGDHSLTHSLAWLLTIPLMYYPTHSPVHSFTYSLYVGLCCSYRCS